MELNKGLEIERKYLIEYPSSDFLLKCKKIEIIQTYLKSIDKKQRRVRSWTEEGKTTYIYTTKEKLDGIKRLEIEEEISFEQYNELSKEIREGYYPLKKIRYKYYSGKYCYEIDVYPFWNDKCVLEVEIEDENEVITFPNELKIIKEITFDEDYKNTYLSKLEFLKKVEN